MAEIAKAAGVGKQTIYRWWPSRVELVADALDDLIDDDLPVTDDPIDDLMTQLHATAEQMRSPAGALLRELLAESQRDDDIATMFRKRFVHRRRSHARATLRRGVDAGLVRRDLDLDDAVDALLAPLWLRLLMEHRPLTPRAIDRLATTVLDGLRPPPAP